MALAKDRYGKVSNCRLYIDYCQYARAISYVDRYSSYGVTYESNIGTSSSTGDEMPWSYNPSLINNFVANDDSPFLRWNMQFNNHNDGNVPVKNRQFSRFLQTANYFGVLGHEFGYVNGLNNLSITLSGDNGGSWGSEHRYIEGVRSIVGDNTDLTDVGYSLYEITNPFTIDGESLSFYLNKAHDETFSGEDIKIGAFTFGRFFDFPQSANLSMNIETSYEGISTQMSSSGRSITNVNYYRPPDWGRFAPWSRYNVSSSNLPNGLQDIDARPVATNGRRSWDLTWSYLDKKNIFPSSYEGTMAGIYNENNDTFDAIEGFVGGSADINGTDSHKANIMGTLMTFTLGGNIPMLFQPSKTHEDFAMVKIDQSAITIQQVAPEMYTIGIRLTEVW